MNNNEWFLLPNYHKINEESKDGFHLATIIKYNMFIIEKEGKLEFANTFLKYLYDNDYKLKNIEKHLLIDDILGLLDPIKDYVSDNANNDFIFFLDMCNNFKQLQYYYSDND
jgi:hypothetical protein